MLSRISSAVLVHTNGLGSSFHASIHDRIERVSSPTERWVLRRNQVVVNAENQRSTRFSQEL
jgi:hypothetical protein